MDQPLELVLLDLDMPIMDGYEACRQILKLYNDKNKFFQVDPNLNQISSKESCSNSIVEHVIEEMFTQPLMIAYSGLVNDEVRQKAKLQGFDVVIDAPLTVDKIQK
jgi:CheY-like chemotaxis protein